MAEIAVNPKTPSAPVAVAKPQPTPDAASPAPQQAQAAPAEGAGADQAYQVPALQAVFAGSPPAVSTAVNNQDPKIRSIWDAREELMQEGIGFYRSLKGDLGVIFNAMFVHPDQLKQADQAGQLAELAPPYDAVESALATNPSSNPILGDGPRPEGLASAPAPTTPQAASGIPSAPAGGQRRLNTARVNNVANQGPMEGPRPGAGRVLNSIASPAI